MFKNKSFAIVLLSFVGLCFGSFEIHPSESQDQKALEALYVAMESMVIIKEGRSESKRSYFKSMGVYNRARDTIKKAFQIYEKDVLSSDLKKEAYLAARDALYEAIEAEDEKAISYRKSMEAYSRGMKALDEVMATYFRSVAEDEDD